MKAVRLNENANESFMKISSIKHQGAYKVDSTVNNKKLTWELNKESSNRDEVNSENRNGLDNTHNNGNNNKNNNNINSFLKVRNNLSKNDANVNKNDLNYNNNPKNNNNNNQ